MNSQRILCDKPLTGAVDAGPDIAAVPRESQRVVTGASALPDVFRNLALPETAGTHGRHGFSSQLSPAA